MKEIIKQIKNSFILLKGYRHLLFIILIISLLIKSMTSIVIPNTIQIIFNSIQEQNVENSFINIAISMICIVILMLLITWINIYGDAWATKLGFSQVKGAFGSIYTKPVSNIMTEFESGDLYQRIQAGSHSSIAIWFLIVDLFSSIISLFLIIIIIGTENIYLLLIYLAIPFIMIIYSFLSYKILKKSNNNLHEKDSDLSQSLFELVSYRDEIQNFGAFDWAFERYTDSRDEFDIARRKNIIDKTIVSIIQDFIDFILRTIFAFIMRFPNITWGTASITFVLYDNIKQKSSEFYMSVQSLPNSIVPLQRLVKVLESYSINDVSHCDNFSLENVDLVYGDNVALNKINLKIKKGDKVAFIGKNGSGKTSVLKILSMQLNADSGIVSMPYTNHKDRNNNTALVPSESQLYSTDVFENINMGTSFVEVDEIHDNLSKLNIENYIYKNIKNLSQGEKQRVSIARAMSKNAYVQIFDEPTSSLDSNMSYHVMQRLLDTQSTVIYSTHDFSLAKMADYIVILESGIIKDIVQKKDYNNINDSSFI